MIRKRQQLDSLSELGYEKMPPQDLIWDGSQEDLDDWIKRVISPDYKSSVDIDISEVE